MMDVQNLLSDSQILAFILKTEANAMRTEPWFARLDQETRYRIMASALKKVTKSESSILMIFGATDDPDDGDRLVPCVRLVYDASRKAA